MAERLEKEKHMPAAAEPPLIEVSRPSEKLYEAVRTVLAHVGIWLKEKPPVIPRPEEAREPGWHVNASNYAMGEADYDVPDEQAVVALADLGRYSGAAAATLASESSGGAQQAGYGTSTHVSAQNLKRGSE